jgi:hypothetical protein
LYRLISLIICVTIPLPGRAQTLRKQEVDLPQRHIVRVVSPNGHWLLTASPFRQSGDHTLTLSDRNTGKIEMVRHYDRSIGVGWAPDSHAFFLNDAYGSNGESSFLYFPGETIPLQLDDLILQKDTKAKAIAADHTYFQVRRWLSANSLLVEYCGHKSDQPFGQFDLLYRITLDRDIRTNATVHRISKRVVSLPASTDECMP